MGGWAGVEEKGRYVPARVLDWESFPPTIFSLDPASGVDTLNLDPASGEERPSEGRHCVAPA